MDAPALTGPGFFAPELLTAIASHMANLGGWQLVLGTGTVVWDDTVAHTHGMPRTHRLTKERALAPYEPQSRRRFEALLAACATDGTPFDDEFELVMPDGRRIWYRGIGRPLRDEGGDIVAIHGACQEITELKHAQQRAHRLTQQLHDTLESMSEAFMLLDGDYRITYVNRVAARTTGRRQEDLLGAVLWAAFPRAVGTRYETEARRAMTERTPIVYEEFTASVKRWFEVRLFPAPDGGLAIYFCDITERRLSEAARRAAESQLWQAQKMDSLGTLAGGIAHDFNNALAAILGNTGLALAHTPPDHPLREHLEPIRCAAEHARELVRRLLAFSRNSTDASPATVQPLAPVLQEAVNMLRVILPPGVALHTELPAEDVLVSIDATGIQQVLLNLCANAWQAMKEGEGRVDVRMRPLSLDATQAQQVTAGLPPGDYARLSVSDNGSGIDEATRARLFEPFFTTKPRGEGTGLGLPVVHGIVMAHHGAISVESTVGQGTTFHIYLPIAPAPVDAPKPPPPPAATATGRGQCVLLVDDDPVVLLATEHILRGLGYDVLAHGDSRQALAAAQRDAGAIDVVVTDFSMPGLSGLDLARELLDLRPGLPVVLSSGYISGDVRRRAESMGVTALVHKENVFEELGDVVGRVLAKGGNGH